jgi:hypothetical protein
MTKKQPHRRVLKFHPDEYPLLAQLIELRPRGWGLIVRDLVETALREGKYPNLFERQPGAVGGGTQGRASFAAGGPQEREPEPSHQPVHRHPVETTPSREEMSNGVPELTTVTVDHGAGAGQVDQSEATPIDKQQAELSTAFESVDEVAQRAKNLLILHKLIIT